MSKQLEKYAKQEEMSLQNHQPKRSSTPVEQAQENTETHQNHSAPNDDPNGIDKTTTKENQSDE